MIFERLVDFLARPPDLLVIFSVSILPVLGDKKQSYGANRMEALDMRADDPNEDHRVEIQAVYWTFTGISTIFILLRIWARVSKRMMGIDDWLMIACWVRTSIP